MAPESITISRENFEVIQPILLVTRFLGILPVRFTKHGNSYRLRKSLIFCIYSYVLTTILTGATLWGIIEDLEKDEARSIRMKDEKTRYITSCDISVVIVTVLSGTVSLPMTLKKFWKLLECLNQVDSVIPLTGHKRLRRSSIVFVLASYVATVLIFTFDIVVWSTTKIMEKPGLYLRNYGTFYILYFIIVTQEIFFWHLIFFIKIRISGLNGHLQYIKIDNFDKLSLQAKSRVVNVKHGVLEKKTSEKMNLVDTVVSLVKFQEKIVEAVQSVNNCSGYGIHLITLSCLLHLIVTPYFLLTELMRKDRNMLFISLQSVWILAHIGRLLMIVEPCQQCLDEHQKTSLIVCELLTSNFDENIKNLFAVFSMQLNCCKIEFTSCGFFKINRSLLTSMAGAVTTYLVILFQFNTN